VEFSVEYHSNTTVTGHSDPGHFGPKILRYQTTCIRQTLRIQYQSVLRHLSHREFGTFRTAIVGCYKLSVRTLRYEFYGSEMCWFRSAWFPTRQATILWSEMLATCDGRSSSSSSSQSQSPSVRQLRYVSAFIARRQIDWVALSRLVLLTRNKRRPTAMDDERMQLTSSAAGTPAILIRKVTTLNHHLH